MEPCAYQRVKSLKQVPETLPDWVPRRGVATHVGVGTDKMSKHTMKSIKKVPGKLPDWVPRRGVTTPVGLGTDKMSKNWSFEDDLQ